MRVVITGGAGFIGTNFVRYMARTHPDYSLIVVDALTYAAKLDNLKGIEIGFMHADIRDKEAMDWVIKGSDYVVNFAAESHVDRSIDSPMIFLDTNVIGTANILEACRKHRVPLLHISTDEVYGELTMDEPPFTEEHQIRPNSPYSAAKAAADLLCLAYVRTYGMNIKITRSSNNYGPYQYPEKMIPLMITNALVNLPLPVYGEGLNVRDWLYVEDNCRGIDLVMHKGASGQVYNIGGGCELRNIDLVKKILRIVGRPYSLITFVKDRPGHDLRYAIDYSKIAGLGWNPEIDFDDGLRLTVDWYMEKT
jgi:dTDP-glucose 4,6-dehydratase